MVLGLGQRPTIQVRGPQFAEDGIAEAVFADLFAERSARLNRPGCVRRAQRKQRRTEQEQGLLGATRIDHRSQGCDLEREMEKKAYFSDMV